MMHEGFEFVPFEIDNFKSNLHKLLVNVEQEFIQNMFPYFCLTSPPEPIEIEFNYGYPTFYGIEKKITLPFLPEEYSPDKCFESLKENILTCAHETGHYLHYFINKEFFQIMKVPHWKIRSKKDRDIHLLIESVAQLSALTFFDITNRDIPEKTKNHVRDHNYFYNSIYDFYCENGKNYCLKTIEDFVGGFITSKNYKDLMKMGKGYSRHAYLDIK